MILLTQMSMLFLMMLIGVFCRKKDILDRETGKKVSSLIVNIANPALILSASINPENKVDGSQFLQTFVVAWIVYGALSLIALVLPALLRIDKKQAGTFKVMTIFSNIGFMGFPIISAAYGDGALLQASLFMLPYNILIYTYGIMLLGKSNTGTIRWKNMINVGVVAAVISLGIYFSGIYIPAPIAGTIKSLSNLTAPLSMMIIGTSLAEINLKELFTDGKLLLFSAVKLLVIPVIGTFAAKAAGFTPEFTGVCMVILATPVGSMTAMLAQEYEGDYPLAAKGVALTTLLSVVTIPLVSFLTGA